jgi:hypothetical protein
MAKGTKVHLQSTITFSISPDSSFIFQPSVKKYSKSLYLSF